MGRLWWLLGAMGVAMVVAGLGAAYWVGPDDWIDSPAQLVNPGGEEAVVTNYGLLSQSVPMRVSASSSAGEVFIGIGHAIDVDDYIATTSTAQIGWFSPAGLMAESRSAHNPALPAAPAGLDFWKARSIGPGTQTVAGNFAGQPVEAVVTTVTGGTAALSVSIGSQLAGAFTISLLLASVGIVLLVGALWFRRRQQRQLVAPAAEAAGPTHSPLRALRTLTVGLLGGAVLLTASGCTAEELIGKVPLTPRKELTRDPLDGLDLTALAADYNRRNDAALAAAAAPRYSEKEWAAADAELSLHNDRYYTAWRKATKDKDQPGQCPVRLGRAYPGKASANYPLTIVVSYGWTCGKAAKDPAKNFAVFIRNHPYDPWLHAAVVGAPGTAPPPPAHQSPDASAQALFESATSALATQLTTGKAAFTLPADLIRWRRGSLKPTSWCTNKWTVTALPNAVRVFQTERGTYAISSFTVSEHFTAKPGKSVGWDLPERAVYPRSPSPTDAFRTTGLVFVLQLTAGEVTLGSWYAPDYS